jgi:hypothetical protein
VRSITKTGLGNDEQGQRVKRLHPVPSPVRIVH